MASEGTARGKERPESHRRPNQLEQLSRRLRLASLAAALRVAGVARGDEEGVHRAVTQLLLSRRLSSPPVPLSACAERGNYRRASISEDSRRSEERRVGKEWRSR